MVVDCGGGTVDITVHEMEKEGLLRELYKATGGAYGGTGKKKSFIFLFFFKSHRVMLIGWFGAVRFSEISNIVGEAFSHKTVLLSKCFYS